MKYLVDGFAFLQKNGIANRDVKPQNIILVKNPNSTESSFLYKVADFGIGCLLEENQKLLDISTISGFSLYYAAPEVLNAFITIKQLNNLNKKWYYNPFVSDVYSLGLVALKMMGYVKTNEDSLEKVLDKASISLNYDVFMPILRKMLENDDTKRLDFLDLQKELLNIYKGDNVTTAAKPKHEKEFYEKWKEENEKCQSPENLFVSMLKKKDRCNSPPFSYYKTQIIKLKPSNFNKN